MWIRKAWTANPADPTAVVSWSLKRRRRWLEITLLESWGVEGSIRVFKWRFESYDTWLIKVIFSFLERRWEAKQCNEDFFIRYYE